MSEGMCVRVSLCVGSLRAARGRTKRPESNRIASLPLIRHAPRGKGIICYKVGGILSKGTGTTTCRTRAPNAGVIAIVLHPLVVTGTIRSPGP